MIDFESSNVTLTFEDKNTMGVQMFEIWCRVFIILFINDGILESDFTWGNKEDLLDFIKLATGLESSNVTLITEVMNFLGANHT